MSQTEANNDEAMEVNTAENLLVVNLEHPVVSDSDCIVSIVDVAVDNNYVDDVNDATSIVASSNTIQSNPDIDIDNSFAWPQIIIINLTKYSNKNEIEKFFKNLNLTFRKVSGTYFICP